MSNDLVSRLRSHAEWGEAGPKANDGKLLKEAATALEEARAEIERQNKRLDLLAVGFGVPDGGRYIADWQTRIKKYQDQAAEIERLQASVTRLTANPADHRYWEGRWRDADRELSTLRARVREVVGPFVSADLADCKDCIDNDDKHYQSQWLADALRAARQLMEEVKNV